jgi:hypothetical protein
MSKVTRRSFLQTSVGVAGGTAIVGAPAAVASRGGTPPSEVVTAASRRVPHEPVMAYVRDARRGEVTLVAGKRETTYRDPELVRRLLKAAPGHHRR